VIAHLTLAAALAGSPTPPHTAPPDHWFGADKVKHFFVAAFTQSVAYGVLQAARVRHDQALVGASAVTAIVSVAKEVHDQRTTGLFSVRDLAWDAAGAAVATVLLDRSRRSSSDTRAAPMSAAVARAGPSLAARIQASWRAGCSYVDSALVLYSPQARSPESTARRCYERTTDYRVTE
jgi:putative lipoprotein